MQGGRSSQLPGQQPACSLEADRFRWGFIMIDKLQTEISAIKQAGAKYLLCYFHVCQEWERFLKSSSSGVRDKKAQHHILIEIMGIKKARSSATFQELAVLFKDRNAAYPSVIDRFVAHWEDIAFHWADFGRLEVLHLRCQTNNLLERFSRGTNMTSWTSRSAIVSSRWSAFCLIV